MSTEQILAIVSAFGAGSILSALAVSFLNRRKTAAEIKEINTRATSQEVEAIGNVRDVLERLQEDISQYITKNIELEKTVADRDRSIEVLTARLQARDAQLESCQKNMEALRNLAKEAPIIETLRSQLEATNQIIAKFQEAQAETQKAILEKDKIMATLVDTNRNLELPKVPKK